MGSRRQWVFNGQHEAIVSCQTWEEVQCKLKSREIRSGSYAAKEQSPLVGLLFDETGDRFTPSHAVKNGRRYRYYIAHRLIRGGRDADGMRLPAPEVESAVAAAIVDLIRNQQVLFELLKEGSPSSAGEQLLKAEKLKSYLLTLGLQAQLLAMRSVLQKIVVKTQELVLTLRLDALSGWIAGKHNQRAVLKHKAENLSLFELSVPLAIQRRGREMRVILPSIQEAPVRVDETLLGLVARGYRWRHEIVQGIRSSAVEIAKREGVTDAYVCRLMGLSFLAPDIMEAILCGGTSEVVCGTTLLALSAVPLDWDGQRAVIIFTIP